MIVHPVVLAGGSGTRLWPLSRERYPKQFLPLTEERTMLQATVARLDGMERVSAPVIVCNEEHRFLVTEQLRELGKKPESVILEPVGRNTAPALTLAALAVSDIAAGPDRDAVMLVMPADGVIRDKEAFRRAVRSGQSMADRGYMVTFGVRPVRAETGYGYLRKGKALSPVSSGVGVAGDEDPPSESTPVPLLLSAFIEKPDLESARSFVESGEYLWNSGIFMMRVSAWLGALERFRDDILVACRRAYESAKRDGDFIRPSADEFLLCPSESIDYAVMEKAAVEATPRSADDGPAGWSGPYSGCAVVPLDSGWSDLGAWSALLDEQERDADGNVVKGDVYALSTTNSLLHAQHRMLATIGLDDVIVVETADAVMVARRDQVQDVREIVDRLKAQTRPEYEDHRKVHRPWGSYEILDAGEGFQVKRLTIKPGAAISLQKHSHRAEHWVIVKGTATVTRGDESIVLSADESTYVPKGVTHRLENTGDDDLHIVEVQSGGYLGEDDIVRFDDRYDRPTQGDRSDSAGSSD